MEGVCAFQTSLLPLASLIPVCPTFTKSGLSVLLLLMLNQASTWLTGARSSPGEPALSCPSQIWEWGSLIQNLASFKPCKIDMKRKQLYARLADSL